jgi:hypothetical protein
MKTMITGTAIVAASLSLGAGYGDGSSRVYEVTFTNITHGAVLTPPIFSLSQHQIDVFQVGAPASLGLEMLAEGGATDELRAELETEGVQDVLQTSDPVLPGQSITVELKGDRWSRLNLASMVLPTNDGFVAMNGPRLSKRPGHLTFYLLAYDAGTEASDELCDNIPGPHCGGEGYNAAGGEGYVVQHAGIHGEADLSRQAYNWGGPVAKVTVRLAR